MCGIAGVMMANGVAPDTKVLSDLQAALAHRGPDGAGQFVGDGIGLVHSRLAIIDLVTGDQPIQGADGSALVANGEIYNYLELRQELAGIEWSTSSDCEPVLVL